MEHKKPEGYENELSDYGIVLWDRWCGEPIAWGFKITSYLGDERFRELYRYGELTYADQNHWVLVVKTLTRAEAIGKYGAVTAEIFGPRGGWKSVTFGEKKFCHNYLRPPKQI